MINMEIIGIDATIAALEEDIEAFELEIDQDIQDAGLECQDLAISACPVDTGNLQSSITYLPDYLECEVFTDVDYSQYVEFGTKRQRPQPYMLPAFSIAKDHLLSIYGK